MPGFQSKTSEVVFVGQGGRVIIEVALEIGPLQQDVVVTAGATELLQARTGAPITVIDEATIEQINKLDVLEALRLVPAAQIVQVGQRGGATSLFLRGGESNFTKVLIDGIPCERHRRRVRLLSAHAGERRAHRGAAPDQQRHLRQRCTDRRRQHQHAARDVARAGARLRHRWRQSGHVQQRALVRRRLQAVRLLLAVPGTTRPTTTSRTTAIATAPTPGASASAVGNSTNVYGTVRYLDGRYGSANGVRSLSDRGRFGVRCRSDSSSALAADSQISPRWQTTVRFGSTNQDSALHEPVTHG